MEKRDLEERMRPSLRLQHELLLDRRRNLFLSRVTRKQSRKQRMLPHTECLVGKEWINQVNLKINDMSNYCQIPPPNSQYNH